MELAPYIYFYGKCEEALEFYKNAIGGTYTLQRFEGSPMEDSVAPEDRAGVMHAHFQGNGFSFVGSDGAQRKSIDPDEGNIVLSLTLKDREEAQRVFDALARGGRIDEPLEEVFWGGMFGIAIDPFGIEWMITAP